jgi:hypothetical protein
MAHGQDVQGKQPLESSRKEKTMRLPSFIPSALAGAIETRLRHARHASRRARLERELSRLPSYVARDIGFAPDQDGFVTRSSN